MTSIKDRIVLITGASSGIGAACARALASQGARLILVARRQDRLGALTAELARDFGTPVLTRLLDVRQGRQVAEVLGHLPPEWQAVEVLINSAGLSRGLDKIHQANSDDWDEMIDTNLKGLLHVSRVILPGMVERGRGHVVNLGSIAGIEVYPGGNVYCATKAGVRSLSQGMRLDLAGTGIRVTNIQPGMVETEFSVVRFHGNQDRAKAVYQDTNPLGAADIADAVVWALNRPAHVNISEITIMPTDQAAAGVVHRGGRRES